MENERLNILLVEYHGFCIDLIKKIPKEEISDESILMQAFEYRDELEKLILELQIKNKDDGIQQYKNEIEQIKLQLSVAKENKRT